MNRLLLLCAVVSLAGCDRETRQFETPPHDASATHATTTSVLAPGPYPPAASTPASAASAAPPAGRVDHPYEENAYAVSQGKRLFRWYNCSGCHGNGGGNMGPPLMDDKWIYGSAPQQIVDTILHGRPNGMPAFAGRIPEDQVWQIAAYVRSMSGQLRFDVEPSRSDSLSAGEPEQRRNPEHPKAVAEH